MTTTLYFGDNGSHEFWESKDRKFLFIRNHGEKFWIALYVNGEFQHDGAVNLKALTLRTSRQAGIKFQFDVASRWLRLYPHHKQMKLVAIPTPAF